MRSKFSPTTLTTAAISNEEMAAVAVFQITEFVDKILHEFSLAQSTYALELETRSARFPGSPFDDGDGSFHTHFLQ